MFEDERELSQYGKKDVSSLQEEIAGLESKLANIPNPNLAVLQEYLRLQQDFSVYSQELEASNRGRQAIRTEYESLKKARLEEFMAGLKTISGHLKQLYQLLTVGGNAELDLIDSLDPFSEGISFSVMPPRKSWKQISNLSGGEKTLSSLALIFALHSYRPCPVYIMDEIDAALDFRNVSIVANYIKGRCAGAQFIVVSLRNDMFELADRLVGIYKVAQRTRAVCIDPGKFAIF